MIKIEKIKVQNFKNIIEADLVLNSMNLLVGANNSGKSNFLKVFSFLNKLINGSNDEISSLFLRDKFDSVCPKYNEGEISTRIEITFKHEESKTIFNYLLIIGWSLIADKNHKIVSESFTFKNSNKTGPAKAIFSRHEQKLKFAAELKTLNLASTLQKQTSVVRLLNLIPVSANPYHEQIEILNYLIKTPIFYFSNIRLNSFKIPDRSDSYGRTISYNVNEEIIKLYKTPKFDILKQILNHILKITDLKVYRYKPGKGPETENRNILLFTHFNDIKLFQNFSDGSKLLISLITKILCDNHSIFLIEEPENSIHPKALVELLNFIEGYLSEKQFIIATHSLTLINKTNPENVIIATMDESGKSTFTNVSSQKDIVKKLRSGYIDFSDYIYFEGNLETEFEQQQES